MLPGLLFAPGYAPLACAGAAAGLWAAGAAGLAGTGAGAGAVRAGAGVAAAGCMPGILYDFPTLNLVSPMPGFAALNCAKVTRLSGWARFHACIT